MKRTRPNRKATKRQVTVRLSEDLLDAVKAHDAFEGWGLTDVLEQGLLLWLKDKPGRQEFTRARFVWQDTPLEMQRMALSLWSYLKMEPRTQTEALVQYFITKVLEEHQKETAGS